MFARQTPDQVAIAPSWIELPGEARRAPLAGPPLPRRDPPAQGRNLENASAAAAWRGPLVCRTKR